MDDDEDREDDFGMGRGRGSTKAAAKQEAAKRALQGLGFVFDDATGILVVELPSQDNDEGKDREASASLEDLAPHLAKHLAIGRDDEDDDDGMDNDTAGSDLVESRRRINSQTKRLLDVYPGTSTTTSGEEDENAYYASRGANVCSALLFDIIQIDARIQGPPFFSYEAVQVPVGLSCTPSTQSKRQVVTENFVPRIHKGPFSCTARLQMVYPDKKQNASGEPSETRGTVAVMSEAKNTSSLCARPGTRDEETLEATAIGKSKREARQMAAAQLLALLFPECSSMGEVKAAASRFRENYASSKNAPKRRKNASSANARIRRHQQYRREASDLPVSAFARTESDEGPSLPEEVKRDLRGLLGLSEEDSSIQQSSDDDISSNLAFRRRLSRQKQVDSLVEAVRTERLLSLLHFFAQLALPSEF